MHHHNNCHYDGSHRGHHHENHNSSVQDHHQHCHRSPHDHNNQDHSANITKITAKVDVPILSFPKSFGQLRRRKRAWVIPPIRFPENDRGPFPKLMVQIRSDADKFKTIRYSIKGPGADQPPEGLFHVDRDSGNLYVTEPLDREKQDQYTVGSAVGSGVIEEPMDIIVFVIDMNDNKPQFTQDTFLGEVPEASPIGFEVIKVEATDMDEPGNANSDIRYRILKQEPELPSGNMFEINPVSGVIRVNSRGLDREKCTKYTLEVQATDSTGEGLSGQGRVILTVTDSNDNAPAFSEPTYKATVPENKVGAQVVKMSVTDGDEPHSPAWNAKFTIVGGDPEGYFTVETGFNKNEGIMTTAKGLDFEKTSKYTLLVAVENEVPFAMQLPTATATVEVNVDDVNEAPIFNPVEKTVVKQEDLPINSELAQYTATDPDFQRNQKVSYKIVTDLAGWLNVNKDTGVISLKSNMDRESHFIKDNKYTALIGAYDRSLFFFSPSSFFDKTGIILTLAKPLPSGEYSVVLRVADNQGMEQDSTVQATVCDCSGEFVACKRIGEAGVGLPVILGILAAILLLLLLVLLLLMFLRRRGGEKGEPLIQDDDIRDNVYYYDEEGGGEDDQDYDLSILHRGLDNRPEVFRNDVVPNFMPAPQYRPRPANPEDIGNFIDDNLKAADNDPTAPPYDSLLVFDYEGGGSDAGSLSSLNSSSSGDQDYDCLSEWGPRFKKLADMYGGEEDDML
uniref:Cadherin-1 n=1 Tax=Myripristis murdjan TaxID=586833 RepID=A0A667X6B9_9TELE